MLNREVKITEIMIFTLPRALLKVAITMASKGVVAMRSRGETLGNVFQRDESVIALNKYGEAAMKLAMSSRTSSTAFKTGAWSSFAVRAEQSRIATPSAISILELEITGATPNIIRQAADGDATISRVAMST